MNSPNSTYRDSDHYADFLRIFKRNFTDRVRDQPLFMTDAEGIFDAFLNALPLDERQHHNCNACRHFVDKYGGLAMIDPVNGLLKPAMWDPTSGIYERASSEVFSLVASAKVIGVFYSADSILGDPETPSPKAPSGAFRHMCVGVPSHITLYSHLKTPFQAMAEKKEEYGMLCRGLADFGPKIVDQALRILEAEALYRSEKVLGPARWLAELHEKRAATRGHGARAVTNITWLAVAKAPVGFCHVRSTMIGTLLEDIKTGLSFEEIKRRFSEKMNPLQYQRPTAPPSAGNIAQAEKIVGELQSAGAFSRRFARLDEVEGLWAPKRVVSPKIQSGIFDHLKVPTTQRFSTLNLPAKEITWEKFAATILPGAQKIEYLVPAKNMSYLALITTDDMTAPPILQWDSPERRNPVSWYVYPGGSMAREWNLEAGDYVQVNAVAFLPHLWHSPEKFKHHGEGVLFILAGCCDLRPRGGAAIFPEFLKSDYHSVRKTIEAHSRSLEIAGASEATACGLDLRKGSGRWHARFRVTTKDGRAEYILDRWD